MGWGAQRVRCHGAVGGSRQTGVSEAALCPSSVCGATAWGQQRRRGGLGPAEHLRAVKRQDGLRGAEKTRDVSSQILQEPKD